MTVRRRVSGGFAKDAAGLRGGAPIGAQGGIHIAAKGDDALDLRVGTQADAVVERDQGLEARRKGQRSLDATLRRR